MTPAKYPNTLDSLVHIIDDERARFDGLRAAVQHALSFYADLADSAINAAALKRDLAAILDEWPAR